MAAVASAPKLSSGIIETKPRSVVTTAFAVTNPTDSKKTFFSKVDLPQGWSLITRDFEFDLAPNQIDTRLLSFFVPQTTLAGEYKVTYTVKDKHQSDLRQVYTATVSVLAVGKLQVTLLEAPKYIISGDEYKSSFVVTNQGNTDYAINAVINSNQKIPYTVDAEKFTLAPGQSQTVNVTIKTDTEQTRAMMHNLIFTARAVGKEDSVTTAAAKSVVEILPRKAAVEDQYHRIPAELTFRSVVQENDTHQSGFQTEFRGQGTLDEEKTKNVGFSFRGPDIENRTMFGLRDEYNFSYWTDDYQLHLGDRLYSLSPLTENYLYARGAEGKININENLTLGAYRLETLWAEPITEENALSLDYKFDENFTAGLNYLDKLKDSERTNITSVETEFKPLPDTKVGLEYALGSSAEKDDSAYMTSIYGNHDWGNYYLRLTHAGTDYDGYYSDLDYITGGVIVPIDNNLRLNANFARTKNNLTLDPGMFASPIEKYQQIGLTYRFPTDTSFTLGWITRDRQDRLESPDFDYTENSVRFGVTQGFKEFSINGSLELGDTQNHLTGMTSASERYSGAFHFRPDHKQNYSGYFYYDKNSDFTGEGRKSTTVGLNASYQLAARTFLGMSMQTNDYQDSVGSRDDLEMRITHVFENEHRMTLLGRHTRYKETLTSDDTAIMLEYTIPLGIPTVKRRSIGSINGYIYDIENGVPISNAILRVGGLTAISDKAGNFRFPALKPGMHYLNVETAGIGLNKITAKKMPLQMAVNGGEKTAIEIPVTIAARLEGRVTIYKYQSAQGTSESPNYVISSKGDSGDTLVPDRALTGAIAEIRNSSEVKRSMTDSLGRFVFEEVRPGSWTLKVYSDNLPEYHYFEKQSFELELKAGQSEELETKVLPQKRRIKIIEAQKSLIEEQK